MLQMIAWVAALLITGGTALIAEHPAQVSDREQFAEVVHGEKQALLAYDQLHQELLKLKGAPLKKIESAILFAAQHHKDKARSNAQKTPYICHPLEVTYDLVKVGHVQDSEVIIGALLHDVPADQLSLPFGGSVAQIVSEVSLHPISAGEAQQRELMIHAREQSSPSAQIELADLLYSLKELSTSPPAHWKKERIDHFFEWAQAVTERFPEANPTLKAEITTLIQAYWDHQ